VLNKKHGKIVFVIFPEKMIKRLEKMGEFVLLALVVVACAVNYIECVDYAVVVYVEVGAVRTDVAYWLMRYFPHMPSSAS